MVDAWDGKPHVDDTVADVFFDNMMGTPLNNVQEAAVDGEEVTVDAGEKVATINAQEVTGVNRDLLELQPYLHVQLLADHRTTMTHWVTVSKTTKT